MKNLALAQFLGIDVISFNSELYANVTLNQFNEESGSNYESVEDIDEDNKPFLNWLQENATLLEDEIQQSAYDENLFEYGSEEYIVVTDEEADELWEQELDYYLEECIYPELSDNLVRYFDDEAWKRDARFDGRGYSLNRYDGNEYEETVYNEYGERKNYYIYRQN